MLAFRLIDLYPPTFDEYFSMYHAAWTKSGTQSIVDVFTALRSTNELHTPLYFVLLQLWGKCCSYEIATGRVLSILISLLAMAMICRISREFVGKAAGFFAIAIVASNALYNFYVPHMRPYPLLVLTAAIVLWQYLRIHYGRRVPSKIDYFALFLASYLLANTHLLSALFFLTLGVYHLLLTPKDRRWLISSLAICAALLLFLPWIAPVLSAAGRSTKRWGDVDYNGLLALESTLRVFANGNAILFTALSLLGLGIGFATKAFRIKPYLFMIAVFLLVVAAFAQLTGYLSSSGMRFLLSSLPLFALFASAGIFALYRLKPWLGLLIFLWVLSGISFHESVPNWRTYIAGRTSHFYRPPWQIVSRMARNSGHTGLILGYGFKEDLLVSRNIVGYSQAHWYFGRFGLPLRNTNNLEIFQTLAQQDSVKESSVWIFYDHSSVKSTDARKLHDIFDGLNYEACHSVEPNHRLLVVKYMWDDLQCEMPDILARHSNALIDHELYGLTLAKDGQRVIFVDSWDAREGIELQGHMLSFQLISNEWENVSQLELPLVHEGSLRRFSIDVSGVPPGQYRLMLILYHKSTGDRFSWEDNPGYVPEMLELGSITIPAS